MLIKRIIQLLKLIEHHGIGSIWSLKPGYSISSFSVLRSIHAYQGVLNTIIDVGANQGQFALAAARFYPNARIYSFEPLPDISKKFKRNTHGFEKITIHTMALGENSGIIDFFRNEHTHASSVLRISKEQVASIPDTSKTSIVKVNLSRLDEVLLEDDLCGPTLLKLDVQGFEKNVIEGASKLLPKIDFIVLEVSFIPMYEGEVLFDEMHSYLKSLGFQLVAPVGLLENKDGNIIQMDFFYRSLKKNQMD